MDTFLSNIAEYASSPQKLRSVSSSWNEAILLGDQLVIDSLHRKYPGLSCLYDIMILIARNNDIDTLKSILISYRGYLPINWNRYSYHVKSVEMLRLLLPYLDRETYDLAKRRIYILTHNTDSISKLELKKYLYAILLEKRYDILTDPKYSAQDWIPYTSILQASIPEESREWLIDRRIIRPMITPLFHERITRENLDKILIPSKTVTLNIYGIVQIIDTLISLLKKYPTDKDVVYPILGYSLTKGYIEILDCYLTKANYIPSLASTVWPYSSDTGIFLVRHGFSSSTDFLRDLPMNILSGLLATLIAKDNLSLYSYVTSKNKANVSVLRDKINKYIDNYDGVRVGYRL